MTIMAKDGTVFETVAECEEYEKELEKTHTVMNLTDVYYDILETLDSEISYYDGFAFQWNEFSSINTTLKNIAQVIVSAMAMFGIRNEESNCQTVEGMWKWVKENKSFGDIIAIYYIDMGGNLIRLWE